MAALCDYLEAEIIKHLCRTGSWTKPTTLAIALIRATRGSWAAATVYAVNDTVLPTTPNGRIYRATAISGTGTSAASEPTWPTTAAGTVVDNAGANQITWTEQTVQLEGGVFTEVANAGAYARVSNNPLDANWAAPSAGSGSGTAQTSNSGALTYAAPTANWGLVFGMIALDSATYGAGNPQWYQALTNPKNVNNGDAAPSFPASTLTFQIDN